MASPAAQPPDGMRVAVKSTGPEVNPSLLRWGITVGLILIGGLVLYATRGALGPLLDRIAVSIPAPTAAEEPVTAGPATEVAAPATAGEEEPSGPQLTFDYVEVMLERLPGRLLELIEEARGELPDYSDLDSPEPTQAERARRLWQNWGRTWHNRLRFVEQEMPPAEECRVHADLEPTCRFFAEVVEVLRQVPAAAGLNDAGAQLDQAAAMIDEFLNPPPEESETEEEDSGDQEIS